MWTVAASFAEGLVAKLLQTEHFGSWVAQHDADVADEIGAYLKRLSETFGPDEAAVEQRSKAVKDSLWGMIDLDGPELVVVDSPPLQRLRRVRQLGFGYLTYPTAGYSRFEHSLGAMHQSERLLRAVQRRSDEALAPILER